MANTEEPVSSWDVERLAVLVSDAQDKLQVKVVVQMYNHDHAYETNYKVSRELLDPDKDSLDQFLAEVSKALREVLEGKRELNAIV